MADDKPEISGADDLGFDPNALLEKYRAERDRRVRAEGNEQYVEMEGQFAHYLEDPYVEPGFTRAPLTDDTVLQGGDTLVISGKAPALALAEDKLLSG